MKSVSLAENLVPNDTEKVLNSPVILYNSGTEQQIKHNSAKLLIQEYAKASETRNAEAAASSERTRRRVVDSLREGGRGAVVRQNVKDRVATLGSEETIYSIEDCGMFASILMAYNNHWNLRTSPDDWWFCVIRRVSIAIDKNSRKDSVRKMFVEHEGKKTIEVLVDPFGLNIYDVDYTYFFDEISKKVTESVRVPEYVEAVTADFSLTTPVQKIVSQVTLMTSLQEFFDFRMLGACGIPAIEMLGTREDWKKLQAKLKVLRTVLEPIASDIGLTAGWWAMVKNVFHKLLLTYEGKPDKEWWSRIVTYESFGSGQTGYTGWFTHFTEGNEKYIDSCMCPFASGLVSVPLTIHNLSSGEEDTAALVAGMLGFTIHEDDTGGVIAVQPFQGWALLLPENSPFCDQSVKAGGLIFPEQFCSVLEKS